MEGNGKVFAVLIGIVAVLSLAIAGLAIYLFTVNSSVTNGGNTQSVDYINKEIIDYDKVTRTVPFSSEGKTINLKKTDDKIHVVRVQLEILSIKDRELDKQLENRLSEIQEIVISTFNEKTIDEVAGGEAAKEKIKQELVERLNQTFSTDKIVKVVINDWFFQ